MALIDNKITDNDVSVKGVVAAPDRMLGTADENKRVFDRLIREAVKGKLNQMIDNLRELGVEHIIRSVDGDGHITYLRVGADGLVETSTDGVNWGTTALKELARQVHADAESAESAKDRAVTAETEAGKSRYYAEQAALQTSEDYRVTDIAKGQAESARDSAKDEADRAEREADRARDEADRAGTNSGNAKDEADRAGREADRARNEANRAEKAAGEAAEDAAAKVKQQTEGAAAAAASSAGAAEIEAERAESEADRAEAAAEQAATGAVGKITIGYEQVIGMDPLQIMPTQEQLESIASHNIFEIDASQLGQPTSTWLKDKVNEYYTVLRCDNYAFRLDEIVQDGINLFVVDNDTGVGTLLQYVDEGGMTPEEKADLEKLLFGMKARIVNLEAAAQGKLYREQVDESAAYVKSVPVGALPYAAVTSIGGKTMRWNQLAGAETFSRYNASCGSFNEDGTTTFKFYNSNRLQVYFKSADIANHNVLVYMRVISAFYETTGGGSPRFDFGGTRVIVNDEPAFRTEGAVYKRITKATDEGRLLGYGWPSNFSGSYDMTARISIIDLTAIYGEGGEPTTTEDPRIAELVRIAEARPQYDPGSEISSTPTGIVSKDADGDVVEAIGTDVPAYISVEPGGSITFVNDEKLSVPSSVTYAINVQEAIANE